MEQKQYNLYDVVEMKKAHPCGRIVGRLFVWEWISALSARDVTIQ